jgi:CDP-glycerol glycerophosphotransferase (TagB/SpsB family)
MKQYIFLFFEKLVLGLFCTFVPQKKGLVLFGSGFKTFSDNPKFLFLHFQQIQSYAPVWISPNRTEVKELLDKGYDVSYKWSFRTFWLVLRAPMLFISHKINDIFPIVPQRSIVINLWHGTPIKKIGFDSLKETIWINNLKKSGRKLPYERWDYFITASPNTTFIFESAMQLLKDKIKPLGQPRTDIIYSNSNNFTVSNKLIKRLAHIRELDLKTKILYTPTFRNNKKATSEIKHSLITINNAINKNKKQVILFKPHPLDKTIFNDRFFAPLDNIINVANEDTQDLLCISDVLITDYSSIMFDFMITGKPIISYIFDYEEYVTENGGLYFSFDEIGTSIANKKSDLVNFIVNPECIYNVYDSSKYNTINSCDKVLEFVNGLFALDD